MTIQIERNNSETETYKQKMQKLMNENKNLSHEIGAAQDSLRLSASQMGKLQNELKVVCHENEELKKMVGEKSKRVHELEEKVILLSSEIQKLRSTQSEFEGSTQKLVEYERKYINS